MAKPKSSGSTPIRPKLFDSAGEISQGIEKLRGRIMQVEELKKDGLPYRDALKVTTEYQVRDTIREVFGDHSPEYDEHQHHRIRVNAKAGVDETISLLQNLVLALEEKRLHLLGFRPRQTAVPVPQPHHDDTSGQPTPTETASLAPPTPPVTTAHSIRVHEQEVQVKVVMLPSQPPARTAAEAQGAIQQIPPPVHVPAQPDPEHPPIPPNPVRTVAPPPPPTPVQHPHHQTRKGKASAEHRTKEASSPSRPATPHAAVAASSVSAVAPQPISHPPKAPQVSPITPTPTIPSPVQEPPTQRASDVADQDVPTTGQHHTEMDIEVNMPPTPSETPEHPKTDVDILALIQSMCTRFHSVARQLRQRGDDRPTLEVEDEIDVHDVLRAMLSAQLDDINLETWSPGYSNGVPRTDLLLKRDGIVIVVKKTRQGVGAKTLSDQLGVDIQRYLNHPLCKTLVCFIYDPEGRIGNPGAFESALVRQKNGRRLEVIISPK